MRRSVRGYLLLYLGATCNYLHPESALALRRYFMQAVRLGMKDAQVRTGLAVVNHMVEPPAALFKPVILLKVLFLGLQDAFDKLRSGLQSRDVQRA